MKQPKIRLKGFGGEWKSQYIGDFCDILTGFPFEGAKILPKGKELLMRGINITEGVIRHNDEIDRYYNEDASSLSKYRLRKNDLVIGMDGSKVGKNSALVTHKEENSLLVQRVARLRNDDAHLIHLIQIALGSSKFFKYVDSMKTSSAIPHISLPDIKNFMVSISKDREEICLISSFFHHLDSLIQSTAKKIESLKQVKAASLQAMFPQEGETTPRVRFKGFEGEWERNAIGNLAIFSKGRGYSKTDLKPGGNPVILYGRLYTNYSSTIDSVDTFASLKKGSVLSKGNEVIIPSSGETSEDIAIASFVKQKNVIIGGDLNIILFAPEIILPAFAAMSITYSKTHYELSDYAQGKTVVHLHNDSISKGHISYPTIDEQQAIASFFTSLDSQITLQTQRVEKLKQIKSACLDKMFV